MATKDQTATATNPADRVAAARAKAEAYRAAQRAQLGTIYGLSEGHSGYWFVPVEIGEGRTVAIRADLTNRGFTKAPAAGVAGVTGAEVWECPTEVITILRGH